MTQKAQPPGDLTIPLIDGATRIVRRGQAPSPFGGIDLIQIIECAAAERAWAGVGEAQERSFQHVRIRVSLFKDLPFDRALPWQRYYT